MTGCAAVMSALVIAACGSANQPTTSRVSYSTALRFSNCMRAQGVPNFPDPSSGGNLELTGSGVDAQSPAFQSAQKACSKFQPGGPGFPKTSASQQQRALRFAQCMRAHGVPNFPDPSLATPRGARSVLVLRGMVFAFAQAINPQAPAFKQATSACGVKPPPDASANAG